MDNPVPVANKNRMVMRSQAYMSIMDWLAIKNCNIEEIQNENLGPWKVRLTEAHSLLKREKNSAQEWILSGFKSGLDDVLENSDVSKAIDVFLEHLRLILEGEYEDEGENKLSIFDQFIFSISDNENSNSSITKPKGIGQDIKKYVRDLSKLIDDLIDLIDSDLIDHLRQIEEEAKADILRDALIEEAIELLNEARANMDRSSGRKIRKLIDSLENILDSLDEGVYVPTREQRLGSRHV